MPKGSRSALRHLIDYVEDGACEYCSVLQGDPHALDCLVPAARIELDALECLPRLLASAWFYGGWKPETLGERGMESTMRRLGWWPVASEQELIAKLDARTSTPTAAPPGEKTNG